MKLEKQIEALAKLDGLTKETRIEADPSDKYTPSEVTVYSVVAGHILANPPSYDSHDDLQRLIDGLNHTLHIAYVKALHAIIFNAEQIRWCKYSSSDVLWFLQATPAQKREAILKATCKWEGGE